ncbi:hypothetical protein F2Q69_00011860 [Brassica cretica]|uniref:FKB95-like N-terminal Kelch domain-containing protein n=1 Tax=Brassica cretica TaxID=69181 RepID=A0A8S9QYR0_BRACR|nr:hypothetical protein F2Q69_00011860 [Brassica cretica]
MIQINQKSWRVVKGVGELLARMICSDWSYTVRYGGNLALLFRRPGKIWCAEISLERRLGGEIWGKVEWCDPVLTGNFKVCKSLAVMMVTYWFGFKFVMLHLVLCFS